MSQDDIKFIRRRINQMLVIIGITALFIIGSRVYEGKAKASKKELYGHYTMLYRLINKQAVLFANYYNSDEYDRDSMWNEIKILQQHILDADPDGPHVFRGPSEPVSVTDELIPLPSW